MLVNVAMNIPPDHPYATLYTYPPPSVNGEAGNRHTMHDAYTTMKAAAPLPGFCSIHSKNSWTRCVPSSRFSGGTVMMSYSILSTNNVTRDRAIRLGNDGGDFLLWAAVEVSPSVRSLGLETLVNGRVSSSVITSLLSRR